MSKHSPFVILDFETGGFKAQKHAITEVAMLCIDGQTLKEVGRYSSYVKPYLYEYDQSALTFTGITLEKLNSEGKELKIVVEEMCNSLTEWYKATSNSYTKKPILVIQNAKFDTGFLQQIFSETKKDLSKFFEGEINFQGNFQPNTLDLIHLSKLAFGDTDLASFSLGKVIEKAGLSLVDAHKAINDVIATKDLLVYYASKMRSKGELLQSETVRVREDFHFKFG